MRLCAAVDCVDSQAHEPPQRQNLTQVKELGLQLRRPANDASIQHGIVVGAVDSPYAKLKVEPGDLLVSVDGRSVDRMRFSSVMKLFESPSKPLTMVFEICPPGRAEAAKQQTIVGTNQTQEPSLIRTSTAGIESLNLVDQARDHFAAVRPGSSIGATRASGPLDEVVRLPEDSTPPTIQEWTTPTQEAPVMVMDSTHQEPISSSNDAIERLSISQNSLDTSDESDFDPIGELAGQLARNSIKELVMQNRTKPIHRGSMFKENRRWTNKWNYFYFVLSPLKIECFLGGSTATLFDEMSFFNQQCSVRSLPGTQAVIYSTSGSRFTNEYLLELKAGDQEWVLACMTEIEKNEWLAALQLAFDVSRNARSIRRSSLGPLTPQTTGKQCQSRPTANSDGATMDYQSRFSYPQPPVAMPKVYATVISASNLTKSGAPTNAICEIKLGTQVFQTGVASNEPSPHWECDNTAVFTVSSGCLALKIRILDEVFPGSFRLIAMLTIPLVQLQNLDVVEKNFPLTLENGSSSATLKLSLKYVNEVKALDSRLREALKQFEDIARDDSLAKIEKQAQQTRSKLRNTLTLCAQMNEAENMARGVLTRFMDLHEIMPSGSVEESAQQAYLRRQQVAFDCMFWRFRTCLKTFSGKNILIRLVTNWALLDKFYSIHEELDDFIIDWHLLASNYVHNWKGKWEGARQEFHAFIQHVWKHKHLLLNRRNELTQTDELVLLLLECKERQTKYSANELQMIHEIFMHVLHLTKLPIQPAPEWLISRHEVDYNEGEHFTHGSYGTVYLGSWSGIRVAVKRIRLEDDPNRDMFRGEADIWHSLQHKHIVRLFAACDAGDPIFISEFASSGTLRDYLNQNENQTWRKLHEAALGLLYLHTKRKIVHGDLKCNNIVVSAGGVAKITDFGASFRVGDGLRPVLDATCMGAVDWKAPEILNQCTAGTLASDIYAFGMCVLEAVKRDNPWGNFGESTVKYKVRTKQMLPNRPSKMSDSQWNLVEQMCCHEASMRIDITAVVLKLEGFAFEEQENTRRAA